MCNAWNHPAGCTCGFGGEGHLGGGWQPSSAFVRSRALKAKSPPIFYSYGTSMRDLAAELGHSVTFPTNCQYCGALIYLYANPDGGFAIFDSLGEPWPKHECWGVNVDTHDYNTLSVRYSPTYPLPVPENTSEATPDTKTVRGVVVKRGSSEEHAYGEVYYLYNGVQLTKLWSAAPLDVGRYLEGTVSFQSGYIVLEDAHILKPGKEPTSVIALKIGELPSTKSLNASNIWDLQFDLFQLEQQDITVSALLKVALDALLSGYPLVAVIALFELVQINSNAASKEMKSQHLKTLLVLVEELNLHTIIQKLISSLSHGMRRVLDPETRDHMERLGQLGDFKLKSESLSHRLKYFDSRWKKEETYAQSLGESAKVNIIDMSDKLRVAIEGPK